MKKTMVLIAHVVNEAVTKGFVPAGKRLGYDVILLTDCGRDYGNFYKEAEGAAPVRILECDVFNAIAVIDLLHMQAIEPDVVFSNSDHLQTVTALVAEYFQRPGKDWRTCYGAKNKSAMRKRLEDLSLPSTWSALLHPSDVAMDAPFPLVAKPCEGVASLDVSLCHNRQELEQYCSEFMRKNPGSSVLLEGFLEGPLFTLETLGDGNDLQVIGGFDVTLSEPPHFVELEANWNGPNSRQWREQALAQIRRFGVGFGVCHSEFVVTKSGPVLIEINYRSIGDGREFVLNDLLPFDWFEAILRLHAGEELEPLPCTEGSAVIRYFPTSKSGHVTKVAEDLHTLTGGIEIRYRSLRHVGDRVQLTHSNKDYLGILTAVTKSPQCVMDAVEQTAKKLAWEVRA